MSSNATATPTVFFSYAWTNDAHVDRVLSLAERLAQDGVHVVIDKWDLGPGQDAYKFMEKLVTDPSVTHAIMISNQVYAEKADAREGGAGTEAQIISPAIYASTDQSKFALVAFELDGDGKPFVPTFYKGRIYINLADDSVYETEYDRLLRWLWGKPLHTRPQLGQKPAHLAGPGAPRSATHSYYMRALDALKSGRNDAASRMRDYRDQAFASLKTHLLTSRGEDDFDEKVVNEVESLKPFVDEMASLLIEAARSHASNDWFEAYLLILEDVQRATLRPNDVSSWFPISADNFRFIARELMTLSSAILIREKQFDRFRQLVTHRFASVDASRGRAFTHDFSEFAHDVSALEVRNSRLNLQRASVLGDILHERYKSGPVSFMDMVEGDLMLFLADAQLSNNDKDRYPTWWPVLIFRNEARYQPTPSFARAESKVVADRLVAAIGAADIDGFKALVSSIVDAGWLRERRFMFGPNLGVLTNITRLGLYS